MREGGSLIAFVRDPDGYRIELIEKRLVSESRLAVIDCGSNSFRLVVFTYTDTWWKRTDEIHEAVRVGEGLEATGELGEEPMERALETLELYAHFCTATGIERDPPGRHVGDPRRRPTRSEFLSAARKRSGLEVEVLRGPAGGALRLPGGGQLDDALPGRRARPRRRLDAAHPRRGPRGGRRAARGRSAPCA